MLCIGSGEQLSFYLHFISVLLHTTIDTKAHGRGPSRGGGGGGGGGFHVTCLNLKKCPMLVFNCTLHRLTLLWEFLPERMFSFRTSFYVLLLLFGPCHLSEFTLAKHHGNVNTN